ncbi:ABC transporter substrate-binding protein [Sinorhizobium sp. A49]|uniref:ABC transporter substrate-binding protein n=1 Tax=Sinorhizobium sp. A49 TaxID=1945861 RepID=UPI0009876E33|nr:ABC transporter substrate-binding protein [Sinorhizobium sp. A49]OOG71324.1 ABC transporter substrate-binding protein [Sinorhizobium sp. A49]
MMFGWCRRYLVAGVLWAAFPHGAWAGEAPHRVVSMNVCTDQMAMLVADNGQLYSVSYLATDGSTSALAAEAKSYVVNHGLAEEIFLMKPDLVIAGTYTTRTTVDLLKRLGFAVEEFAPEASIAEVRTNLQRMGRVLGRQQRADELLAAMDAEIARLQATKVPEVELALYYANGFTSGSGTLVADILGIAGLENLADRLGISGTGQLPLEALVLARPDLIAIDANGERGPALAKQNFSHPAFRAVAAQHRAVQLDSRYTICGGPFTLIAASILQQAALKLDALQLDTGK